jgi:hypothetical protein
MQTVLDFIQKGSNKAYLSHLWNRLTYVLTLDSYIIPQFYYDKRNLAVSVPDRTSFQFNVTEKIPHVVKIKGVVIENVEIKEMVNVSQYNRLRDKFFIYTEELMYQYLSEKRDWKDLAGNPYVALGGCTVSSGFFRVIRTKIGNIMMSNVVENTKFDVGVYLCDEEGWKKMDDFVTGDCKESMVDYVEQDIKLMDWQPMQLLKPKDNDMVLLAVRDFNYNYSAIMMSALDVSRLNIPVLPPLLYGFTVLKSIDCGYVVVANTQPIVKEESVQILSDRACDFARIEDKDDVTCKIVVTGLGDDCTVTGQELGNVPGIAKVTLFKVMSNETMVIQSIDHELHRNRFSALSTLRSVSHYIVPNYFGNQYGNELWLRCKMKMKECDCGRVLQFMQYNKYELIGTEDEEGIVYEDVRGSTFFEDEPGLFMKVLTRRRKFKTKAYDWVCKEQPPDFVRNYQVIQEELLQYTEHLTNQCCRWNYKCLDPPGEGDDPNWDIFNEGVYYYN